MGRGIECQRRAPRRYLMEFTSTRNPASRMGFSAALRQGMAADGGLLVPVDAPHWKSGSFVAPAFSADTGAALTAAELARTAGTILQPFVVGDALADAATGLCDDAFSFPAPLKPVGPSGQLHVLELFHGPTAAFKDFGARFLAACFQRLQKPRDATLKILVATSGDTGGAVAAAFHRRPGIEVAVLYPRALVSPTQQQQLTCWGDNVRAFEVAGTFDDCQRMVKLAFGDAELTSRFQLSSANSINLGRLVPQAMYYAASSLSVWQATGRKPSYIIPAGNLGNSLACFWARSWGLPIGEIVLAFNGNRTVADFLATGQWQPRASIATLASAMDVGDPSNMERLRALYPEHAQLRAAFSADNVADEAIRQRIVKDFAAYGEIWCPHTATAAEVYARMPASRRQAGPWILVATAHPAKFRETMEPLLGQKLSLPPALAALFDRPSEKESLANNIGALRAALQVAR